MQRLTENIYTECYIKGCNPSFITTKEGVVMIDTPQFPLDAVRWREQIAQHGKPIYLINTEPHIDHITGNYFFREPTVIAHQGVKDRFTRSIGPLDHLIERTRRADPEGVWLLHGYQPNPPSTGLQEDTTLKLGDHTIQIRYLPGHTNCELAVIVPEERVAFVSDNVFCRVQTFLQEAYPDEWLAALKEIATWDVDYIVPGHGEVCTKDYLPEQAAVIEEWVDTIQRAIDRGLTKERAAEEISFLDRYPMGQGLDYLGPWVQRANVWRLYDVLLGKAETGRTPPPGPMPPRDGY